MSSAYLDNLEQSIHETFPSLVDPHVLKSILPAILFALVARNTNVVINTPAVIDISKSVSKVLSAVFGMQTKRIRIRSLQSPHDMLMSLLAPSSPSSSSTLSHKRNHSHSNMSRSYSASRPSSSHFTEGSDSTATQPLASSKLFRYKTDPHPSEGDPQGTVHLSQVIIISGLEHAGRAAQLALAEVLRKRQIILESEDDDNGSVWNLPDEFFLMFISELGDGHERPAIHTTLLDHFALSVTLTQRPTPATAAPPSPRLRSLPLPSLPQKPPLLPFDQMPRPDTSVFTPLVSHYITALLTATRHHPELDGMLLTARCVHYAETLVRASGFVFRDDEKYAMITEIHVRRTMPAVLAHRLRVRDSPREQIMGLLWKGAGVRRWGESIEEAQDNRRTVKEILAEILAEV